MKDVITFPVKNNHMFYNSDVNATSRREHGVDFLIHRNHNNSVIEFNAISSRLAVLKLRGKYNNVTLIQCYAPTTTHPDEKVDTFYSQLQQLIDKTSKRDILFVMGDFNAKIGNLHTVEPEVVGPHNNISRGHIDRGKQLVAFSKQNELFVANSKFKQRRKYTWTSPGDRIHNTIDYILV